jgi:hypothetical protein
VRARYWQYDQTASPLALVSTPTSIVAAQSVTVVFPGGIQSASPGQVLEVSNGLRMQTLDFEGTQSIDFGAVDGLLGVGLRYATLRQTYDAAISGAGFPQQTLSALREFEGVGPVISGEFRRPISRAGLSGFVGVGGGVFFGRKSMHREVNNLSGSFPPIVNMDDADEVTGMGELQFGLEWSRCTSLGQLFVRGDYGAQLWTDAGAPTLTFLGLEGFSLSLGVLH